MDIALRKKNVYNPVEVINMSKEVKTNAMRMLDKHHIQYDMIQYECDEFIDGLHTAEKTGAPVEQSFKTLVAQGKSKQYYVFVVPIAEEVQLKQAAKVAGEKSVELIPVKEITKITGYVRGGCSPLGMKKLFPTFIHNSAENFDKIYVSGGRIGTTICLNSPGTRRGDTGTVCGHYRPRILIFERVNPFYMFYKCVLKKHVCIFLFSKYRHVFYPLIFLQIVL